MSCPYLLTGVGMALVWAQAAPGACATEHHHQGGFYQPFHRHCCRHLLDPSRPRSPARTASCVVSLSRASSLELRTPTGFQVRKCGNPSRCSARDGDAVCVCVCVCVYICVKKLCG